MYEMRKLIMNFLIDKHIEIQYRVKALDKFHINLFFDYFLWSYFKYDDSLLYWSLGLSIKLNQPQ